MRLEGKVIVVTGASRGLGRRMADAFVEEGGNVMYSARSAEQLTQAVRSINVRDPAGDATSYPADVREWGDVTRLVDETIARYGPIDVFFNNAGLAPHRGIEDDPVEDVPVATWDAVVATNLRGPFLCTKAVLPGFLERDKGRIVHISAGHGTEAAPQRAPYCASKFGLEGFHEALALEIDDTNVDSIALRPPRGGVYTESAERSSPNQFSHPSPDVIATPAVQIAAGHGENGGRYQALADGTGVVPYSRTED